MREGLKELRERIDARSIAEAEQAKAETRRDLIRTALLCVLWAATGITLILWSAHTTSLFHGKLAFFFGIAIGNGGIGYCLLAAYRRGELRGDW